MSVLVTRVSYVLTSLSTSDRNNREFRDAPKMSPTVQLKVYLDISV